MPDKKDMFGIKASNTQDVKFIPRKRVVVSDSPMFLDLQNAMSKFAVAEQHHKRLLARANRDPDVSPAELEQASSNVAKYWSLLCEAGFAKGMVGDPAGLPAPRPPEPPVPTIEQVEDQVDDPDFFAD
ncbi:MAG: hypothetical protein K0U66_07395 [Gammaproteobacteria bacterium]|nr:hypothetical protein [Gammaproteobacteria bacterium]